jgi:Fibronectin type III domain
VADPLITLDTERTSAQPGGQARVSITVTNPGTVVEGYRLQALGPLAPWSEVVPPEVSVYPQQEVTAALVISPPTGTGVPSGLQPFGVIARSTLDPNVSAVAEGDIEIGQVFGLQAKIIPVTSSGRWRGRHVIQLSNWGNAAAQLRMNAFDQDNALGFYLRPVFVNLQPGGQATVRLSARTKHPFLRGTPVRLPFQVAGEPLDAVPGPAPAPGMGHGDLSRPVVDAALNQKPILSKAVIILLALLLAGIIALIGFLIKRGPIPDDPLAPRGAPAKPVLKVTSVGPDSIGLSWEPIDQVQQYNLQYIQQGNVNKVQSLEGAVTSYTATQLTPATEFCFRLSATANGLTGPLSEQVCQLTAPPSPSPSPTPTPSPTPSPTPTPSASSSAPPSTPSGGFTPGDRNTDPIMNQKWIAVATQLPKSAHVEADAQAKVTSLATVGVQAKYLDNRFYPRMLFGGTTSPATPTEESFLVYVGPFDSQTDAQNQCDNITNATTEPCIVAQPDPP